MAEYPNFPDHICEAQNARELFTSYGRTGGIIPYVEDSAVHIHKQFVRIEEGQLTLRSTQPAIPLADPHPVHEDVELCMKEITENRAKVNHALYVARLKMGMLRNNKSLQLLCRAIYDYTKHNTDYGGSVPDKTNGNTTSTHNCDETRSDISADDNTNENIPNGCASPSNSNSDQDECEIGLDNPVDKTQQNDSDDSVESVDSGRLSPPRRRYAKAKSIQKKYVPRQRKNGKIFKSKEFVEDSSSESENELAKVSDKTSKNDKNNILMKERGRVSKGKGKASKGKGKISKIKGKKINPAGDLSVGELALNQTPTWLYECASALGPYIGQDLELPTINHRFCGSCIGYIGDAGLGILLHTTGPKLENLAIRPVKYSEEDSTLESYKKETMMLRPHGIIYEIDVQTIKHDLVILRYEKAVEVLQLDFCSNYEALYDVIVTHRYTVDEYPTSVKFSPYIAGEYAVALSSGQISLYKMAGFIQELPRLRTRFQCNNTWWSVYFGAHPRQLVTACITHVEYHDIHTRGRMRSRDIFAIPHKMLHKRERIMTSQSHPTRKFYHFIATDFQIIMVDQRFSNHPVLHWTHSLLSPPAYISISPDALMGDNTDVLYIGAQDSAEVICHLIRMGASNMHPQFIGLPWRASKPADFVHLLYKTRPPGVSFHMIKRLKVPLIGIHSIPKLNAKGSILFQVTSHGDQFTQNFEPRVQESATQSYGPISLSEKEQDHCQDWLHKSRWIQGVADNNGATFREFSASVLFENFKRQFVSNQNCALCTDASSRSTTGNFECMTCGTKSKQAAAIKKSVSQGTICERSLSQLDKSIKNITLDPGLKIYNPLKYGDLESKLYQALWKGEDVMEIVKEMEAKKKYEKDNETAPKPTSSMEDPTVKMFRELGIPGGPVGVLEPPKIIQPERDSNVEDDSGDDGGLSPVKKGDTNTHIKSSPSTLVDQEPSSDSDTEFLLSQSMHDFETTFSQEQLDRSRPGKSKPYSNLENDSTYSQSKSYHSRTGKSKRANSLETEFPQNKMVLINEDYYSYNENDQTFTELRAVDYGSLLAKSAQSDKDNYTPEPVNLFTNINGAQESEGDANTDRQVSPVPFSPVYRNHVSPIPFDSDLRARKRVRFDSTQDQHILALDTEPRSQSIPDSLIPDPPQSPTVIPDSQIFTPLDLMSPGFIPSSQDSVRASQTSTSKILKSQTPKSQPSKLQTPISKTLSSQDTANASQSSISQTPVPSSQDSLMTSQTLMSPSASFVRRDLSLKKSQKRKKIVLGF